MYIFSGKKCKIMKNNLFMLRCKFMNHSEDKVCVIWNSLEYQLLEKNKNLVQKKNLT